MVETKIIGSASALNNGEIYKTHVVTGAYDFIVDEPQQYGGGATGPAPADYLCMALASCKVITIRMYVQRKGWKVEQVSVNVNFVKGDQATVGRNTFFCEIKVTGELTIEQQKRILEIVKICPIERLLGKSNEVVTVIEKE
jgi:putative redox protein